ncbi:hypothetical protein RFI_22915, partial [Reticulomyxa filosa]
HAGVRALLEDVDDMSGGDPRGSPLLSLSTSKHRPNATNLELLMDWDDIPLDYKQVLSIASSRLGDEKSDLGVETGEDDDKLEINNSARFLSKLPLDQQSEYSTETDMFHDQHKVDETEGRLNNNTEDLTINSSFPNIELQSSLLNCDFSPFKSDPVITTKNNHSFDLEALFLEIGNGMQPLGLQSVREKRAE